MLARNIAIADIDARHWLGWYELLVPARVRDEPYWALVLLDDGQPFSITVHGGVAGARPARSASLPFTGTSLPELDELADELDVHAVVVIDRALLPVLHGEIDRALAELGLAADVVAQWLTVVRVLDRHSGRGLWSTPAILDLLPPLSYEALQGTFDLCTADHTSLLCYVFAGGDRGPHIHASILAVKEGGDLTRVATHAGVADTLSEQALAASWRDPRTRKRLLEVVARRYAPPGLAVFVDRAAFQRILTGPADQPAREMNAGNVVIDPAPAWLLGLLGGATMAALATRSARALARMLPRSARQMASELASTAQTVMRDSGVHPFALLGFDPIELWHSVRQFYR